MGGAEKLVFLLPGQAGIKPQIADLWILYPGDLCVSRDF
jgi:hypothetical protein